MRGQQAIGTLFIFIALVITAALAAGLLTATTQALQSQGQAVAQKTQEKFSTAFSARSVEGLTTADEGNIEFVIAHLELAPGSPTIDLDDVTMIWQAAGGTVYQEFDFNATSTDLNTAALGTATPFTVAPAANKFHVVNNRSDWDGDRYVESGEVYALVIQLSTALNEGEDWVLTVRAPYTADLEIRGYAPEVLQAGQVVKIG